MTLNTGVTNRKTKKSDFKRQKKNKGEEGEKERGGAIK